MNIILMDCKNNFNASMNYHFILRFCPPIHLFYSVRKNRNKDIIIKWNIIGMMF